MTVDDFSFILLFAGGFFTVWLFIVHRSVDVLANALEKHNTTFEHFLIVCQGHEARLSQLEQDVVEPLQRSEQQTQHLVRPGCEL